MSISVVIPVFNEAKYIRFCLDSLMKQTVKPKEVIIVDNNCTDDTIDICRKYEVKIIKEKKQGMIFARNGGFNAASGDIIARCDADVILPADWLERIDNRFKTNTISAITGLFSYYDVPLNTTFFKRAYTSLMKVILKGNNTLLGPNMAIRRSVWNGIKKEVCLDDKKVHEDIDLSIHIISQGGKIFLDKELTVYTSARRMKKNPFSFFFEYPYRFIKTLLSHKIP